MYELTYEIAVRFLLKGKFLLEICYNIIMDVRIWERRQIVLRRFYDRLKFIEHVLCSFPAPFLSVNINYFLLNY